MNQSLVKETEMAIRDIDEILDETRKKWLRYVNKRAAQVKKLERLKRQQQFEDK